MNPAFKTPEISGIDKEIMDDFRIASDCYSELVLRNIIMIATEQLAMRLSRYYIDRLLDDIGRKITSVDYGK